MEMSTFLSHPYLVVEPSQLIFPFCCCHSWVVSTALATVKHVANSKHILGMIAILSSPREDVPIMDAGQLHRVSEKSPGENVHAEAALVVAALCRQLQKCRPSYL